MTNYDYYIGFDVSKLTLNYCLRSRDNQLVEEGQIGNDKAKIRSLFCRLLKELDLNAHQLFCLVEHTGLYSNTLIRTARRMGLASCLEDALRINKAFSRQQDKSDPEDARIISLYALERAYRLDLWREPRKAEDMIRALHRRRRNLVKNLQSVKTSFNNSLKWDELPMDEDVMRANKEVMEAMEKAIMLIDNKIEKVIVEDEELRQIYDRARSVPGLGPKNTIVILLETWFFKKITTAKACCNYAGLRPIDRKSVV